MKKSNVNKVLATAVLLGTLAPGMSTVVANAQTPTDVKTTVTSTEVTTTSTDVKGDLTESQKAYLKAQTNLLKKTLEDLKSKGESTGNWQGYKSIEALVTPLFYNFVNGVYVENKNFYAEKLASALAGIQTAETAEVKAEWEKTFKKSLDGFRNAPSKNGIIPKVIGVNDTEALAKENNVPSPKTEEVKDVEGKVFTPEMKEYINGKIDLENNTRQSLILDAISSGDWNSYKSVEAIHNPAWYSVTEDGQYVENKVYFANMLESNLSAIHSAETTEDKAIWQKELESNLEKFRNAHSPEGIVPYVVGINNNIALAKQYNVPLVSSEYFDSKYNYPTVIDNGKFKNEADNDISKIAVINKVVGTPRAEVKGVSINLASFGKTAVIDSSKLVEVTPNKPIDLGVNPNDGFSDHEKALIQEQIDTKNNTRQALIMDAIVSGDWNDYYAFEAQESPAWFMVTEDGKYVKNKFYYASLLESTVRAMNTAETQEIKDAWKTSLTETLQDFRNAPTPNGIIPHVVGINHNEVIAKEFNVPEASDNYFDSKYNSPTVLSNGTFGK